VDGEALRESRRPEDRPLQRDGHLGEELRAGPVQLGPLLTPPAFGEHRLVVGDGRGDLAGGQAEEELVVLVAAEVRLVPSTRAPTGAA
jgi:hypothetical protein